MVKSWLKKAIIYAIKQKYEFEVILLMHFFRINDTHGYYYSSA